MQETDANVRKSGEHAQYKWSFCKQKYYVQVMIDCYELRGGDDANEYCKRYFQVKLSETDGEAFNTLTM